MTFSDRVVWITGASSGIGEALAYEFAQRGATLVLTSRREGELNRVKEHCEYSARHLVWPMDLADPESTAKSTQELLARMGHIDIFVHSGGISQRAPALDTQIDVDRRIMEINYFSAINITKALLPSMISRGRGHIVPISSLVGKFGTPLRSAYAASKHALHGFYDSLRAEVHEKGVRVTVVCPGFVKTNVSRNALTGDGSNWGQTDPGQEGGLPAEECAQSIVQAIVRSEEEVLIGGKEVLGVYVKRLAPNLFNKLIRRARVT